MIFKHLSFSSQYKVAAAAAASSLVLAATGATITQITTTSTPESNDSAHRCQQQYKYKFIKQLQQFSLPAFSPAPKINCYCSPLDHSSEDEECRSFNETLQHHKRLLSHYQQKWNWHNATSRIPTTSWPLNIPSDDEIPGLEFDLKFCERQSSMPNNDIANHSGDRYCSKLQFRVASYMLLQPDVAIQKKGLQIIQKMAESKSNPDAICAYATCLNDGRAGIEPNPTAAVSWWKTACDHFHHIQSAYEMGVALYTGEGVAEDEVLAVEYFRVAAENGHAGASYMLGDCLLDGVGVKRDRGEALEWLVIAADLGHRGARSRVLAVLEKKEGVSYGQFTDASRQTLIENNDSISGTSERDKDTTVKGETIEKEKEDGTEVNSGKDRDAKEKPYSTRRPVTLEHRFTIGGGAKNPAVLARRRTIVTESRQ